MGYKGGIGTSSRVIDGLGHGRRAAAGNFGARRQLASAACPVGRVLVAERGGSTARDGDDGGCIGVVLTDIPLDARQLTRVARRVGIGLSRVGIVAHHGSGDIFCAVSTTNRMPRGAAGWATVDLLVDDEINDVFAATVDATEEAAPTPCSSPTRCVVGTATSPPACRSTGCSSCSEPPCATGRAGPSWGDG